ncbi:fumarate hydratase C-terminal domain-containing protein, partial [Salmonella enterica subsp. enterica serovar Kentucky]|nr:fumarate hydratase C-terminal domain-containing protein [Salmonella enterica subsp. enterica serovar Kentucky]
MVCKSGGLSLTPIARRVCDILFLTGFAYTCRDAAHKKIEVALSNGEKSPVDFQNQTIYYA